MSDSQNNAGGNMSNKKSNKKSDKNLGIESLEPMVLMSASPLDIPDAPADQGPTAFPLEVLEGTEGSDHLVGTDGTDLIRGNGGNDLIEAGEGDDLIFVSEGFDQIDGGEGKDAADFFYSSSGVQVDLTTGSATGGLTATLSNVEVVLGSLHDDIYSFSQPKAGDSFEVIGVGGFNTLDLTSFSQSDIQLSSTSLTGQVNGGQFEVEFYGVSQIVFADGSVDVENVDRPAPDNAPGPPGSGEGDAEENEIDNHNPEAQDDYFETEFNTPVAIPMLENDSDADGDEFFLEFLDSPLNGFLDEDNDGNLLFVPNEGFSGVETINYRISDGSGSSQTATVTIRVNSPEGIADAGNNGSNGNDNFEVNGDAEDQVIDGLEGQDTVTFDDSVDQFDIEQGEGELVVRKVDSGQTTRVRNVEFLEFNDETIDTSQLLAGDNEDNVLNGNNSENVLSGGADDDTITGEGGNDFILGGTGNDTVDGGSGNDRIAGNDGNDQLIGNAGHDELFGGAGDDILSGGSGNDLVFGNDGNDFLEAGSGTNLVDGGAGNDTFFLDGTISDYDVEDTGDGELVFKDINSQDITRVRNVENIQFQDQVLTVDEVLAGTESSDEVQGGDGDDTLLGGGGNDQLSGGEGDDLVVGGTGDDVLDGGDGDDVLIGGNDPGSMGGDDTLSGGDGDDVLIGDDGDDTLSGDAGDDEVLGGEGDDVASGGEGDDNLVGDKGDDNLFGDAGDDNLSGGDGDDTLVGGEGDDVISGGDGDDVIETGSGNDTVEADAGDDVITSTEGADFIDGGDGNDTLNLAGSMAEYLVTRGENDGTFIITDTRDNGDAPKTVTNVENISFDDGTITEDALEIASDANANNEEDLLDFESETETVEITPETIDSVSGVRVYAQRVDEAGNVISAEKVVVDNNRFGVEGTSEAGVFNQIGMNPNDFIAEQLVFEFDDHFTQAEFSFTNLFRGEGDAKGGIGDEQGKWEAFLDGKLVASDTFVATASSAYTGAFTVDAGTVTLQLPPGVQADTIAFTATRYSGGQNGSTADSSDFHISSLIVDTFDPMGVGSFDAPAGTDMDLGIILAENVVVETSTLVLSGIPEDAILSHGERNEDGTWTLKASDAADVTMRTPTNFVGELNIEVELFAVTDDSANSVFNSSFENNEIVDRGWGVFDEVEGWHATDGAGIEVQENVAGDASHSDSHVELDSHNNSGMYQDVPTVAGQSYQFSFDYSPRPGVAADSNAIEVFFNGEKIDTITADGTSLSNTQWETFTYTVEAGGAESRIEFRATGTSDSFGGYIDLVRLEDVVQQTERLEITVDEAGDPTNFISNGSFEDLTGLTQAGFGLHGDSITAWELEDGPRFEVHNPRAGVDQADDGDFWLDMDASPGNVTISQQVLGLEDGMVYDLSFATANSNPFIHNGELLDSTTNQLEVYWNGEKVSEILSEDADFTTTNLTVRAGSGDGTNTLTFKGMGNEDNIGISLDNVRMVSSENLLVNGSFENLTGMVDNGWGWSASDIVGWTNNAVQEIDFSEGEVGVHGGDAQDRNGVYEIQDDGETLFLPGNGWKSIPGDFNITANTVIEFEYRSTEMPEFVSIGFDTDATWHNDGGNDFFKIFGSQQHGDVANNAYEVYEGNGEFQTIRIPVGQFMSGEFDRMTFINDDDNLASHGDVNTNAEGNSFFRNVRVFEAGNDFESHRPRGGVEASDGDYWMDMGGSPGNLSMSQHVPGVEEGQSYVLSFDVADSIHDNSDGLRVIWNGEVVGEIDEQDAAMDRFQIQVTGGSGDGSNTLTFEGTGDNNNFGVALDNVDLRVGELDGDLVDFASEFDGTDTGQATGTAGTELPLGIQLDSRVDIEGSTLVISGLPEDSILNVGTENPDGTWTVAAEDAESVAVRTPNNFTGEVTIHVRINNLAEHAPNLVFNGSFENNEIVDRGWGVFDDVEGWQTSSGEGIEVQENVAGSAAHGDSKVELDSHDFGGEALGSNTGMFQNVPTRAGDVYNFSFEYSPRPGVPADSNGVEVYWNGELLGIMSGEGRGLNDTQWTTQNFMVEGTGETGRIEFKAVGTQDSLGGFIDNVSLKQFEMDNTNVVVNVQASDDPNNFIANGSFEDLTGLTQAGFGHHGESLNGWEIEDGPRFEVHNPRAGVETADDGDFWLDMDASPGNMTVSQQVLGLENGTVYDFSFATANSNPFVHNGQVLDTTTNGLEVFWNGEKVSEVFNEDSEFTTHNLTLRAGSGDGSNTITFRGLGNEDNVGISLDNVRMVESDNLLVNGSFENVTDLTDAGWGLYGDSIQGWTTVETGEVVSQENFEGGAEGWSDNTTTTEGSELTEFLGKFGGSGGEQLVSKTFELSGNHEFAVVEFDFLKIDSWDSNNPWGVDEQLNIFINDMEMVSFTPEGNQYWGQLGSDSAEGTHGNVRYIITSSGDDSGMNDFNDHSSQWQERVYRIRLEISDPGENLKLGFGSTLNQSERDESFGIDNITVFEVDNPNADLQEDGTFKATGDRFESHRPRGGVEATDGDYWMDMGGSPGNLTMSQHVPGVVDGESYSLSFDLADSAHDSSDGMKVFWNGEVIGEFSNLDNNMERFEFQVTGGTGDGSNTLTFEGTGNSDNFGVSLDNVVLKSGEVDFVSFESQHERVDINSSNLDSDSGFRMFAQRVDTEGNVVESADIVVQADGKIGVEGTPEAGVVNQIGFNPVNSVAEQIVVEFDNEFTGGEFNFTNLFRGEGDASGGVGDEQGKWEAFKDGQIVATDTFVAVDNNNTGLVNITLPDGQTADEVRFTATEFSGGQNGSTADSSDFFLTSISVDTVSDAEVAVEAGIPVNLGIEVSSQVDAHHSTLTIRGLPEGAVLSAGTDNGDGTWTVPADQAGTIALTTPTTFSGETNVTVEVNSVSAHAPNLLINGSFETAVEAVGIQNPGFEGYNHADGQWSSDTPGWETIGSAGDWDPTSYHFPNVDGGEQVAWANTNNDSDVAGFGQTLATTLDSTKNYELTVDIGNRIENYDSQFEVRLIAGSTVVGSTTGSISDITNGSFSAVRVNVQGDQFTDLDGSTLRIEILNTGTENNYVGQVNFDNVRLMQMNTTSTEHFSQNADGVERGWGVFDEVEGWQRSDGSGIEIQERVAGDASDGFAHVELDSHNNSGMFQDVATEEGRSYQFSFDFSPRPGIAEDSNSIEVYWNGELIDEISAEGRGLSNTQWERLSYTVDGIDGDSRIEFRAAGTEDSLGGYLDNVSLHSMTQTSASSLEMNVSESADPENYVANGSFEDTSGRANNAGWGLATQEFSRWNLDSGQQFEVVDSGARGVDSTDGERWLDMDASPGNIQVSQQVLGLNNGDVYTLSFDTIETPGREAENNGLEVFWNGEKVNVTDGEASTTLTVRAGDGDGTNTLTFKGTGDANGYGLSLDNVRMIDNENLLVNGSFENLTGLTDAGWGHYGDSIQGWEMNDDSGAGDRFESHNPRGGVEASDGNFWMDMGGSPGNLSMSQHVPGVVDGEIYDLSFDLADSAHDSTNGLRVLWNGDVIAEIANQDATMDRFQFAVIGGTGDASNTLTFEGTGNSDNFGVSLDNVTLKGANVIVGTDSNERLNGTAGTDAIEAKGGNDSILAGAGSDIVSGGTGNDHVWGGAGSDILDGGEGDADYVRYDHDTAGVNVDLQARTASGGEADGDQISNFERAVGGKADDTLSGDENFNVLHGRDGNDTLDGRGGNDHLHAEGGDDNVFGGEGNDHVRGGDGSDNIDGGEGNDSLYGDAGNDTVQAGAGNDHVWGGAGSDILDGGEGDADYVRYDHDTTGVNVDLASQTVSGGEADGDQISNFERAVGGKADDTLSGDENFNVLHGRDGNDTLDGRGGNDHLHAEGGDDNVFGGEGNDHVRGGDGSDNIDGGEGNDSLYGDAGNDTVQAGAGNDHVWGGAGSDILDGGEGDADYVRYDHDTTGVNVDLASQTVSGGEADGDQISNFERAVGGKADDTLSGDENFNVLHGRDGNDTLDGRGGNDHLHAEGGDDNVFGGEGNDHVRGGDGSDNIDGGEGNDSLYGDAGNDTVQAGAGNDHVWGGAGSDILDGGEGDADYVRYDHDTTGVNVDLASQTVSGGEADGDQISNFERAVGGKADDTLSGDENFNVLHGRDGNDTLDGRGGNDHLHAEGGDDNVFGGEGNDHVRGGDGSDNIDGGEGNDRLYGDAGDDSIQGGAGNDTLLGGHGNDRMDGGSGSDTAVFGGNMADYSVHVDEEGDFVVTDDVGDNGTDMVVNVETLKFDDHQVGLQSGGVADDTFIPSSGDDIVNGNDGYDTVRFSGNQNDYSVTRLGESDWLVQDQRNGSPEGTTRLLNIEVLHFVDVSQTIA